VDTGGLGITETDCFSHVEKIGRITIPTLIIHAQYDQFIPLSDARTLLAHSPAQKKQLLEVNGADHNSVIMMAGKRY
jgi:pimeloyl-ACP methyl ester carboxylesterase